jgi:hypothetical protein
MQGGACYGVEHMIPCSLHFSITGVCLIGLIKNS